MARDASQDKPIKIKNNPTFLQSSSFRNAQSKAESYANNPLKLEELMKEAQNKSKRIHKGPLLEIWSYLMAMFRLIRAYYSKTYRHIPWSSILMIIAGIVYFVSPMDMIPDWIPALGFLDDAAVLGFLIKMLRNDLNRFMKWEETQIVPGDKAPPKPTTTPALPDT
ncbi:MAG: YkvA family protein [Verrucomicrobiota bacterium]